MSLTKQRKINPNSIFTHKPIIDRILAYAVTSSDIINISLINKQCQTVFKTKKNQLKLKKRVEIERIIYKIEQNELFLGEVKEQTPEICMAAVKQNGWALQYVNEQTLEICLAAVKQDGRALQFVKEQTPEICMAAVKRNKKAINFVNIKFIKFI